MVRKGISSGQEGAIIAISLIACQNARHVTLDRYGEDSLPLISYGPKVIKRIPFSFTIKIPKPLKTGVDYGFLPGKNVSQAGKNNGLKKSTKKTLPARAKGPHRRSP